MKKKWVIRLRVGLRLHTCPEGRCRGTDSPDRSMPALSESGSPTHPLAAPVLRVCPRDRSLKVSGAPAMTQYSIPASNGNERKVDTHLRSTPTRRSIRIVRPRNDGYPVLELRLHALEQVVALGETAYE